MGYIGTSPVAGAARVLEGSGTGDGTTVAFAMGFSPAAEQEVLVFIDGGKQDTDAYSISGSTCTFTAAPMTGENIDFIGFAVGKSTVPQENSVDQSKINTGSIRPIVNWERTDDGEVATGTTIIPLDDTIPQITEGDEYITVSITPTSATNILIIEAQLILSVSNANYSTTALFQDTTADALTVALPYNGSATGENVVTLNYEVVAGTTSSTTFRIRAGGTSGTMTFNGDSGIRRLGGACNSYIKVTEVMA